VVFNKVHGNNPKVVDPLVCHLRGNKILSMALFALSIAMFALSIALFVLSIALFVLSTFLT
jgi:hypothetical protein